MSVATTSAAVRRLRAALPYAVVLAAGIYLYYSASNFEFEEVESRIGPGAWPKLVLGLMLLAALWGFVGNVLRPEPPEAAPEANDDAALIQPPEIYPGLVWLAISAVFAYLLLLPILGFFIATALLCFALMLLGHFRRLVPAAVMSVVFSFAFLFLFMRVVYVALPLGITPFNDVSYALMALIGVR